ncbi:MAG: DMT family transporter [Gammaproteobacteria bacterium]|nr:DMT family transporter [Gammaproteobacteria bacterium]MDE2346029.1 DMT family transporter [Gammaproteobacteria bacterium]
MFNLILGAVMISFSAVFVKLVSVPPETSAFYRMLFGGLILLGIVLWRRERLKITLRAAAMLLLVAVFFALDLTFWHRSILYVGPGLATLLANFQVFVLTAVGVLAFGERMTWFQMASIPLAVVGLVLLVGLDWQSFSAHYRLGVLLGLLTACCYAAYLLALRRTRISETTGSPFVTLMAVSLLCAGILALLILPEHASFAIPHWKDAGWLVAYGIFGQVLGWVLISSSISKVRASQVGLVLLLQPVCAFIWDVLFFGRRFTLVEIGGTVLAMAAIYLGSVRQPR